MIEVLRELTKLDMNNFKYLDTISIKNIHFVVGCNRYGECYPIAFCDEFTIYLEDDVITIERPFNKIEISIEDLLQDDSYLILKYGRILSEHIKN